MLIVAIKEEKYYSVYCSSNKAKVCHCSYPLWIGVEVELDLSFGSKWLVIQLVKHSISADKLVNFHNQQLKILTVIENNDINISFRQSEADNVDPNIVTLTSDDVNIFDLLDIFKLIHKICLK